FLGRMPERGEEAEAALRKAIELDPKYASSWNSLGHLLGMTPERADEAEAALRKSVELDPKSFESWHRLGLLLMTTWDRADEAESAVGKAVEIDPAYGLWGSPGFIFAYGAGKPKGMEIVLRRLVELEPDSSLYLLNLGVLLYGERLDQKEGVHYIRRAH